MNTKITKKILEYTVLFEPDAGGGFVASVPTLPSCVSQGENFEDAVKMIQDAISGYVEVLKTEGLEIPIKSSDIVITKISVQNPSLPYAVI